VILTVTANAALDVTYEVPVLRHGEPHRVERVHTRAGGKGVNVARVLHALGEDVVATGLVGGLTGDAILADLEDAVPEAFLRVAGESRRTVAVVSADDGAATVLNEPGPQVSEREWDQFAEAYHQLAAAATLVVLSGSLPPGVPADAYAELIVRTQVPVLLDTDGDALRFGIEARPALVKPNLAELTGLLGHPPEDVLAACRALPVPAAVTLGEAGAVLVTADGAWRAVPPERVRGNPTGAGDAFAAGLARGLAAGEPWPDVLADAMALAAAAVAAPVAGEVDPAAYASFRGAVVVEEA
jgi:tagatose 6-phosphate kinase